MAFAVRQHEPAGLQLCFLGDQGWDQDWISKWLRATDFLAVHTILWLTTPCLVGEEEHNDAMIDGLWQVGTALVTASLAYKGLGGPCCTHPLAHPFSQRGSGSVAKTFRSMVSAEANRQDPWPSVLSPPHSVPGRALFSLLPGFLRPELSHFLRWPCVHPPNSA